MPPPDGLSGGDKLTAYLADLAKKLDSGASVEVGFLEGSTEADGTSVPTIASFAEFGTGTEPPRPFFRSMIGAHSGEWGGDVAKLLAEHDNNAFKALSLMGQRIGGQLRQSIIDLTAPPLSPITLMLREMQHKNPNLVVTAATVGEAAALVKAGKSYAGASTKPLVWSGTMLASIEYETTGPSESERKFVDESRNGDA